MLSERRLLLKAEPEFNTRALLLPAEAAEPPDANGSPIPSAIPSPVLPVSEVHGSHGGVLSAPSG